jgi:hypothetical protein
VRLRRAIAAVPARSVVGFVDACRSGLLLTAKGIVRAPPLTVELTELGPQGHVLITSSGANELSHESRRLQASPFSAALISALRGAADADQDGRITVEEVYAHLYKRTLAATVGARAGPQHAEREVELRGSGPLVLADVSSPDRARLVRTATGARSCYVLDSRELEVRAELAASERASISLAPGPVVVACPGADDVLITKPTLPKGITRLEDLSFRPREQSYALVKGESGEPLQRATFALGALLWPSGRDSAVAAVRFRHGSRALGVSATIAGLFSTDDKPARALVSANLGYVVPWWRAAGSSLELGLLAGGILAGKNDGRSVLLGQYAELDWSFGPLSVSARADLGIATPINGSSPAFVSLLTLGVGWEGGL